MNEYNPYSINQQFANFSSIPPQQSSPYLQTSPEKVSSTVNSSIEPSYQYNYEYRQLPRQYIITNRFRGHQYFVQKISVPEIYNSSSAFASITEIKNEGGILKPILGGASMEIFNVIPDTDHRQVIVTGRVWWDSDLDYRISLLVFP